jgi:FkbM family methyltransferase
MAEPIAFYLMIDGVYELGGLSFILSRLRRDGVFVDVGACIGSLSIPIASAVGPLGQVVAIEASERNFRYLSANTTANALPQVQCVHSAVSDRDGDVEFYEAPIDHFGMGSMGPQFHAQPSRVPGRCLDHILAEAGITGVDVLKVDVEGFEAKVFRGAENLLRKSGAPLVVFEFIDWAEARLSDGGPGAAQRLLREWGFKIWRLQDFVKGNRELSDIVSVGSEMLVAKRG